MSTSKPTVVFVPGAWHIPAHYEPIINRLRDSGYEVVALRHPSCTVKSDPGNMLHQDANAVADTVRKLLQDGKDAVVIMHSYGGISGPEGVATVMEEKRAESSASFGSVRRLVFLAAHVLEKGISMEGLRGKMPNMDISEDGMMVHRGPKDRYYNDVSAEDAKAALGMLQPMTYSSFTTPTRYAGWKDYGIPCTYIKCLKDNAVTKPMWDEYIARWKGLGIDHSVEELDLSHSPFWSDPDTLLVVMKRVLE